MATSADTQSKADAAVAAFNSLAECMRFDYRFRDMLMRDPLALAAAQALADRLSAHGIPVPVKR